MKSALECFQQAAECEQKAKAAVDDAGRKALLATARQWRFLGDEAKAASDRAASNDRQKGI